MKDRVCGPQCGCGHSGFHPAGSTVRVEVVDGTGRLPEGVLRGLEGQVRAAGAEISAAGEVRVRVVGDAEMDGLHRKHTGVAGTTDVLTFDLRDMGLGPLDVDIVVCLDEAQRQAGARGHGVERELLLYVVHGLMHCLGHDDHEEAACARMHAAEDALLTAIGVGPVYARPEGGGR